MYAVDLNNRIERASPGTTTRQAPTVPADLNNRIESHYVVGVLPILHGFQRDLNNRIERHGIAFLDYVTATSDVGI